MAKNIVNARAGSAQLRLFAASRSAGWFECWRLLGRVAQVRAVDRQFGDNLRAAAAELIEQLRTGVALSLLECGFQRFFRRLHIGPGPALGGLFKGWCGARAGKP